MHQIMRRRYVWLFCALLVFFVVVAVTRQLRLGGLEASLTIVEVFAFVIVIGGVAFSISRSRAGKFVTLMLGVPAILLWFAHLFWVNWPLEFVRCLFGAAFLSYAIVLMLLEVFHAKRVTGNILCASMCGYVLLGVVWAYGYSMICILDPNAFLSPVHGPLPLEIRMGSGNSVEGLYFSFTTLTTLGYGDIVPTGPIARAVVCLEAIVGQLYLAVLIARMVGLHIVHELSPEHGEHKPK